MMTWQNRIYEFIWDERFWLPRNHTWDQVNKYNDFSTERFLLYPVYVAFLIYFVRLCFERLIAVPIARLLDVKEKSVKKFKPNEVLEVYFKRKHVTMSEAIYLHLSRETGLSPDSVKEWFELRKYINRPSVVQKFSESLWRFFFYLSIWIYGFCVLYNKTWLWDTNECWNNYPRHQLTDDIYWYYVIELAFYLSLLVSQFFDVKRKDFWQMFLHHVLTISLMLFSLSFNFHRIGTLILLLHDCSDFWLEIAKVGQYAKMKRFCDTCFCIFTITWFCTRITTFPLKIIYSTTYELTAVLPAWPAFLIMNSFLYVLQVLHLIWFYMICKIAYKALTVGEVEKDDRSESDYEENEEKEIKKD